MFSVSHWVMSLFSTRDRRKACRQETGCLEAYYWNGAAPVSHRVRNISSTGLYLLTEERWYPGTLLRMTLQRTDVPGTAGGDKGAARFVAVEAMVIRPDKDGVGFAFIPPMSARHRQALGVESNLADRKILEDFIRQLTEAEDRG